MECPVVGSTSTRSPGWTPIGSLAVASSSPWGCWTQPAQLPPQLSFSPHSVCRSREIWITSSFKRFFTSAYWFKGLASEGFSFCQSPPVSVF